QQLVHARFPKSRGVKVGRVVEITPRGVVVETDLFNRSTGPRGFSTSDDLKIGDGIVFDEGHPEQDEQGGRIASVTPVPSPLYPGERARVRGKAKDEGGRMKD